MWEKIRNFKWRKHIWRRRERELGEMPPPWYYGLSYINWCAIDQEVWYPIPVNYIVRFFWDMKSRWDSLRGKIGRMDYFIMVHATRQAREMSMRYRQDVDAAMNEKFRLQQEQIKTLQDQIKCYTDAAREKLDRKHK